jgi:EAL domain-containing protein (putative c-di-GMP-specific phosphodiesterase class I)
LKLNAMAINISAREFREKGFLDSFRAILAETHMEPKRLEIELTESAIMQNGKSCTIDHDLLKNIGVGLTVDDFGTGYSSLSYLRRFPIDTLKIDKSLVQDITVDREDATIVTAMIGMGASLKQRVVAEGVETRDQLMFLREQGCRQGQGYYFCRPLPAGECADLLRTGISQSLLH